MYKFCRLNSPISPSTGHTLLTRIIYILLFLFLITSGAVLGCAHKHMTLEDAKQTIISMRGKSFVPPPRSIDDILGVIASQRKKDALALKDLVELSKKELPTKATKSELIEFYFRRGEANFVLGLFLQSREDLRKAYDLAGFENAKDRLISFLGGSEQALGNHETAAALFTILKNRNTLGFSPYFQLASLFANAGYFDKANSVRREAIDYFGNQQSQLTPIERFFQLEVEYVVLNMRAKYKEAEKFVRSALISAAAIRPHRPDLEKIARIQLIRSLIDQNRLVEAELEARKAIAYFIQYVGPESFHSIGSIAILAEVLLAQGRPTDAEKVSQEAVLAYDQIGISSGSESYSRIKNTIGKILLEKGDYIGAMRQYDLFLGFKDHNRYIYDTIYSRNLNVMLSLIMTGRSREAMELIEGAYQSYDRLLGKDDPLSAEILALRGMVNYSNGNLESAYHDFSSAIPLIAKSKTYTENRLANKRLSVILESYLNLLSELRGSLIENNLSISAAAKAFEVSTLLGDSTVQAAIIASTTRQVIKNPRLEDLARTEQDVRLQIKAYQNLVQELLAKPVVDIDRHGINNLKTTIDSLTAAREIIVDEIQRQFPDYANLVNPQQTSLSSVQSRLKPNEVIISICSTENSTYVFVVSQSGPPEMVSVPIAKNDLENLVSELKKSFLPMSDRLGQLPVYDFAKAHELYLLLLKPVEAAWKDSKHVILTTSGPLGLLPFTIMTTGPFQLENEKKELFSNYREAPWLIKRISITTVPSASSFEVLRARSGAVESKEVLAGFGDPFFNKMQMAQALNERKSARKADDTKLDIRGIRLTKDGDLDNKNLFSCTIESLERLPDTADELLSIAETLGANPVRDVYLGRRASEKQVKNMDLSDRRVVAFASHALVPYDLDGLDQPAIALSAPSVTGDEDDGLLTMAEILDLKLNADWVVLSACNTGAAEGAGAEAVSGLGRAFFYAGTRALLVSMWPVETSSAKKLTTSIFRHQKENPGLSKARAQQMATLELIDGPGMVDEEGRIIASYAHPFFWAPFIIVGDN